MRRSCAVCAPASPGFALIAVLWMVAAMTLLVSGVVTLARSELKDAAMVRDMAQIEAVGDAAIQQAIVTRLCHESGRYQSTTITFASTPVQVSCMSVGGLVSINVASRPLLVFLFEYGAHLSHEQAEALADRLIWFRTGGDFIGHNPPSKKYKPRAELFVYPEDLLQVPGITLEVYARIARLISTSRDMRGVDPAAASLSVLTLLAKGDRAAARRVFDQRQKESAANWDGLESAFFAMNVSQQYRVEAVIHNDGRDYRRTQWITLSTVASDKLPWQVWRIEAVTGVDAQEK